MQVSLNVHQIIKTANAVAAGAGGNGLPTMPIHLLYGCTAVTDCLAARCLATVGINLTSIARVKMVHRPDMTVTSVLKDAEAVSIDFGNNAVVSEALLFVLCTECLQTVEILEAFKEGTCKKLVEMILTSAGIDPKHLTPLSKKTPNQEQDFQMYNDDFEGDVLDPIQSLFGAMASAMMGAASGQGGFTNIPGMDGQGGTNGKPGQGSKGNTQKAANDERAASTLPPELLTMGCDLTAKAKAGKIDTIIGRDEETARVIEILCRKTKNNPVLIGEAGVGKSAIVEGLAMRIVANSVPESLKNRTIFSLDIGSLMAGTKFRGELEQRLENLIKVVTTRDDVILFIDELHQITTATGKEGEIGISEMLKPRLARGELQTIGATTTEEYRKFIEKDAALERRFQPIIVNPPSAAQAIEILRGLKPSYEKFHNLNIGDDAIVAAVTLSDRYVTDRNLPDKALDLLDEACAKVKVNKKNPTDVAFITSDNIAEVLSKATGIPVKKMTAGDKEGLVNLEQELAKSIIGQGKALEYIAKAIRRSRVGVGDPNRPVGSFMFLGRTGVGKTEVCKVLAKHLFANDKALIKLDMSEFTEAHSVSKLIGSPPGYVGYDDGAVVCERVRRCPYCIVLFDEIEKAHPDVYNVLLQILDEGRLTDNRGKTTSFRNAIIIMTSNCGVDNLTKTAHIGFSTTDDASSKEEEQIMAGLKKRFRPEFINRIDNIVVFNSLTEDDVLKIARLRVNELVLKMESVGVTLSVDDAVIREIVKKGYSKEYGARPIKRLIQTELEDKMAEHILTNDGCRGVRARINGDKIEFDIK